MLKQDLQISYGLSPDAQRTKRRTERPLLAEQR
jgi:hypothetical protein